MRDKLWVTVARNRAAENAAHDIDTISEAAVADEAEAVMSAVKKLGHKATPIEIGCLEDCLSAIFCSGTRPDVIFNLCEGLPGNSGGEMHIASMWELSGVPFTGNRAITLGTAQDKVLAKRIFRSAGIPTPDFEIFESVPDRTRLPFPLIAKPSREDASLGITGNPVINNMEELREKTAALLKKYKQPVLAERYIDGREFNVSILGDTPPRVLAVAEIDFSGLDADIPRVTTYEAKWLPDHPAYKKTPSVCPADIDAETAGKLSDVALAVFNALNGKDYGRVDMRMDKNGSVYVLEYNPNPDISPDAGFAKALKAAGMDYCEFVDFLLKKNSGGK
jgi:D-alanine-D-alanine ligase